MSEGDAQWLNLRPELQPGEYVFCRFAQNADVSRSMPEALCMFREREGITLILPRNRADALAIPYEFIAAWIALSLETSLEAVGLTAKFSQALSQANISCNVVAAYHHDHIFVPIADATKAMQVLQELSKN